MRQHIIGALIATVLLVGNLVAGVIPGRWEKIDSLPEGEDIVVVMKSGERFQVDFRSSDLDSLTVKPMGGKERRVPKAEVAQIEREGVKQDRALDGAAIGAAVGAAIGALIGSQGEEVSGSKAVPVIGGMIPGAAIGFGVGYGVDSSRGKPILLYQATE